MSDEVSLSVKFHVVEETKDELFKQHFPGHDEGLFKSAPGGFLLTLDYAENGVEKIYNIKPRDDDVCLVTFPKTGKRNSLLHFLFVF